MAASALAFKPVVKAAWRAPVRRGDLLLARHQREVLRRDADDELAAEILEGLTVSWGRGAIKELLDTGPRATTVTRAGWWLIRATVLGRSSKPDLDWNTHFTTLTVFVEAK